VNQFRDWHLEKDTYKWVQGLRIIISSECFQTGVGVESRAKSKALRVIDVIGWFRN
jgi:hypothetical protein